MENYVEKPLGLFGWIKAKLLARKLRRRWKNDREFKARVQASIESAVKKNLEERKTIKTL